MHNDLIVNSYALIPLKKCLKVYVKFLLNRLSPFPWECDIYCLSLLSLKHSSKTRQLHRIIKAFDHTSSKTYVTLTKKSSVLTTKSVLRLLP